MMKQDKKNWVLKRLEDIALIKGGFAFDSKVFLPKGKYQIIKMCNLYEGVLNLQRSNSYVNKISTKEKEYLLLPNDILITLTGTVGKRDYGYSYQIRNEENLLLNQRIGLIRSFDINSQFLYLYINTTTFLNYFFLSGRGGTGNQANVSTNDLGKILIPIPPIKEQKKIVQLLSIWVNAIEKQTTLVEKLEIRKKAYMKLLFSQKYRFKNERKNYPNWKEITLKEIGTTYNGLTGKSIKDFGSGKPYIQYKQIFDNSKIILSKCGLVNVTEQENQNKVKFGDIFFTTSSETPNEVGLSSVLLENTTDVFLNSFSFGFRPYNLNELNPFFARYLFRSEKVRLSIIKLSQGSTRYNMSKNAFLKIKVSLPSLPEQQKIADFLSLADKEIDLARKKLALYKQQKKALMQQLLTGKTRVRIDS